MSQTTLKDHRQPVTLAQVLDDAGCLYAAVEIAGGATPGQVLAFVSACRSDGGGRCEECERARQILEVWTAGEAAAA